MWRIVCIACVAVAAGAQPPAAADEKQRRVLALHATRREAPASYVTDDTLQEVLGRRLQARLDYYSEFIDTARFADPNLQPALRDYLTRKYSDLPFDVLIAPTDSALEIASAFGDELFVDVPIVFSVTVLTRRPLQSTGVTVIQDLARTLDVATRLQPESRRVFVVTGASAFDKYYEDLARKQFRRFEPRLEFTYLSGLSRDDLLARVAALPPDSILYPLLNTEDRNGQRFLPLEMFDRVAETANAPVYALATPLMNRGAVGGGMFSLEIAATRLAELTLRVLEGEKAEDIPVVEIDPYVYEVDWRQLKRWGISEARVPAGTTIRFRDPGLWERYRSYIIGTVVLLLLQTTLIGGLLVQLRRRRKVESALRESEARFRVMADTAPVMIWRSGTDKGCDFFNQSWLAFRGRTEEQEMGSGWAEGVHPADLDECLRIYTSSFDERRPFRMEYRLRRADGEYRWVLDHGVPRFAPDGTFAGFIGSCIDITDRQRTETELRHSEAALRKSYEQNQDLAGRLITAQEAERARIARDLHDDVSQQLAGLAITVSGVRHRLKGPVPVADVETTLTAVQELTSALAENVRSLSHEMHSGVLQYAGLVPALKEHCVTFQRHHQVDVTLQADGRIDPLPPDVALCLYRVAQEALANIPRHARAHTALVRLARTDEGVELDVVDDGVGFDAEVRNGSGLGLRSIEERVRLAKGGVRIESRPGQGTKLLVRIALAAVVAAASENAVNRIETV